VSVHGDGDVSVCVCCVAVSCIVLSVLQCVAMCCSVLLCITCECVWRLGGGGPMHEVRV